jgi:hypothetical protein
MKLKIGDRIVWQSVAGMLLGDIDNIVLSENGNNETVAWLDVKILDNLTGAKSAIGARKTRLCAVDSNLKMLSVELAQE